jgi:hypothetical protein
MQFPFTHSYGQPRILTSSSNLNLRTARLCIVRWSSLAPLAGLTAEDFIQRDKFFRMGRAPIVVDILPEIGGVDFDRAWENRVEAVI